MSMTMRFRGTVLRLVIAALLAALLVSCSPRRSLVVEAGVPGLQDALSRLAAEYRQSTGLQIMVGKPDAEGKGPVGADIVIDWGFIPSMEAASGAVGDADVRSISMAHALSAWTGEPGEWTEVPVLWDCWGLAVPRGDAQETMAAKAFSWKERRAFLALGAITAAGGETGTRQALFWLSDTALPDASARARLIAGQDDPLSAPWREMFSRFPAFETEPMLVRDTFHFTDADIQNQASLPGQRAILGPYSRVRTLPSAASRDFLPVIYPLDKGYALPAAILTARLAGSSGSDRKAAAFIRWLLLPENQQALSEATGLMAVNLGAPLLDPQALSAREAMTGAAELLSIDPEPREPRLSVAWGLLVSRLAEAPALWAESVRTAGLGSHE